MARAAMVNGINKDVGAIKSCTTEGITSSTVTASLLGCMTHLVARATLSTNLVQMQSPATVSHGSMSTFVAEPQKLQIKMASSINKTVRDSGHLKPQDPNSNSGGERPQSIYLGAGVIKKYIINRNMNGISMPVDQAALVIVWCLLTLQNGRRTSRRDRRPGTRDPHHDVHVDRGMWPSVVRVYDEHVVAERDSPTSNVSNLIKEGRGPQNHVDTLTPRTHISRNKHDRNANNEIQKAVSHCLNAMGGATSLMTSCWATSYCQHTVSDVVEVLLSTTSLAASGWRPYFLGFFETPSPSSWCEPVLSSYVQGPVWPLVNWSKGRLTLINRSRVNRPLTDQLVRGKFIFPPIDSRGGEHKLPSSTSTTTTLRRFHATEGISGGWPEGRCLFGRPP
ncbi:hypothetical protein Sjap_011067 [Stephania japonica]|uniref:Uncharacterized protein n=1 Tax=Stephania japonica TaxID=461633 RepID=A0AAP0JBP3_9MAGN